MPVHLGAVDTHSGVLALFGLDFLQLADPSERTATSVPRVVVTRDDESWGLEVDRLRETSLAIHGERSSARFGIWDRVVIQLGSRACTERRQVGEVLSVTGCFVVIDPAIAEQLRGPTTTADVACWGSQAARIADGLGLDKLRPDTYGYREVPIETAPALEQRIHAAAAYGVQVATYPRTQGYLLERQLDAADSAVATIGTQRVAAFRAHQDGSWPVFAELAHDGSLLALAISFV
jgi:hypothetical protein